MNEDFVQMDGLGNTFVVYKGPKVIECAEVSRLCRIQSTDGLLVVTPIDSSTVEMKYWNADGSTAEMCGNGLRCSARFAVDESMVMPGKFTVRTDSGDLEVKCSADRGSLVEAQIGRVEIAKEVLVIEELEFHKASVGNPHAVTFVDSAQKAPVKSLGPRVENNPAFPDKTNVEFVEIVDQHSLKLRVWERGVGETQACGTGMVAAAAVASDKLKIEYPVKVSVMGGEAKIWVDDKRYMVMSGPAKYLPLL